MSGERTKQRSARRNSSSFSSNNNNVSEVYDNSSSSSTSVPANVSSTATHSGNKSRLSQKTRRRSRATNRENSAEMQGWLLKWTNYVKGYQRRWFVLSHGVLSYYLDQSEVHKVSRGSITLSTAVIEHVDSCTFALTDGNKQSFRVRADTEAERQKWISALELTKCLIKPTVETPDTVPDPTLEVSEHPQQQPKQPQPQQPQQQQQPTRRRRTRIPDKPNYPLNLWSLMKNCIGKDLSKIPMPVNFNEPLSLLQRLVEDYEYSQVLDTAAACADECEQMAHLAAFTISAYATAASRISKPFNPLLGETYECDRTDDLGWRSLSEQVSHHPPVSAVHCESKEWVSWQEFSLTSKFRGKYLQVNPGGGSYVIFHSTGRRYSWRRVTTTVNNIIVGKLWVDLQGQMEIVGSDAAEGFKCVVDYIPYSYFGREQQRTVKGVAFNRKGEAKWVLRGTWDDKVEIAPVLETSGSPKNPSYTTGDYQIAWQRTPAAPDADKYYNFPQFACQLNEPEEGVAPTDSRLRPDQRFMEDGDWDASNREKLRLEEKQRAARKQRETLEKQAIAEGRSMPAYEPKWFKRQGIEDRGATHIMHIFANTYWQAKEAQDWTDCPDIF